MKRDVKIRGLRSPIPNGHLIGRTEPGEGDGHIIKPGNALELKNRKLAVAVSGDVNIDNGVATVVGLQGVSVDDTAPALNDVLTFDGSVWTPAPASGGGTGDVVGPASAVNNHVVFFDGATGKLIKDSGLTLSGSNTGDQTLPVGANPTATAKDTAVNGAATTFMRSDAAPAIQKASSSQFGIVQVDGSTITESGGVISAVGGGGASPANPTATASDVAVNGSASTYMRSDAAPAVQKGSASQFGIVKVDGSTITESGGVISAPGGASNAAFDTQFFGDGSDGDLSISSGTTTITRDMFYNNLTISGTAQLRIGNGTTGNFKIHVKGTLDISAAAANAIFWIGTTSQNGTNALNQTQGSGGGDAGVSGSIPPAAANGGGNGATGGTGAGAQAAAGAAMVARVGAVGGNGGAGGSVGATAGGASRAVPTTTLSVGQNLAVDFRVLTNQFFMFSSGSMRLANCGQAGTGGSAGAGDGTGSGGGGGGGGSGGPMIFIAAKTINRSGSTTASAINARGGNGGNGASGSGGTNRGGGGGGAGGGGGWIYLIYRTLTGSTATNCLDATGGDGGSGGNGVGTGNGGNGGGAGGGGRIQVFDLGAGTQTLTAVTAAVAGNAASGGTGGGTKTATAQQASL